MPTEVNSKERLIWLGLVLLVLVFALWSYLAPKRGSDEPARELRQTRVEARCGIAAGRSLSGEQIAITCGLDNAGIESVIAKAIEKFDLPKLVSRLQQDTGTLQPELVEMALQLGLTHEALVELLTKTTLAAPGSTLTPQRLAESITRETPALIVNVISTVSRENQMRPGVDDPSAIVPRSSSGHAADILPVEVPPMEKLILRESQTLHVECGLGAGEDIKFDTADIKCGPNKEDINAIVGRLIAQSNVTQLVGELRQGALTQTRLIDSFEKELGLSRSTMLQLLKRINDGNVSSGQAAGELTSLVERHIHLTYRLGQLAKDDQAANQLREVVAKMIAAGNYPVAETLLSQWSQLTQAKDELRVVRQSLAELDRERNRDSEGTQRQAAAINSGEPSEPLAPQPEKNQSANEPPALEDEKGTAFISQEKVELDAPVRSPAGSTISFAWRGPAAPDDLIFILKPDVADNSYPISDDQRHRAALGSPANLVAPAEPGAYEIRYFSYANGEPLLRAPLEVTPAQVSLMAPTEISAGSVVEFAWQGPNAPGDLIFIADPDMADNRYFLSDEQRHPTSKGSPALLVVPAAQGNYEVRYFSYNNATKLASKPILVSAPEVSFSAPKEVTPGAHMRFPWKGPGAPGDLIFISKSDSPDNEYPLSDRRRHRTSEGATAELVAPAKPGQYEIRYFSYANGKTLASQSLTVQ